MCTTKPAALLAPFFLIGRDGACIEFDDLPCLAAACLGARITLARSHVRWIGQGAPASDGFPPVAPWKIESQWIARDVMGKSVAQSDLEPFHVRRTGYLWRRQEEIRWAQERGLPIPHTGRSRRCYLRSHRNQRFRSVWRQLLGQRCDMFEQDTPRPRGRMAEPFNPWLNRYEESSRASSFERNWKRFRRTQWKHRLPR